MPAPRTPTGAPAVVGILVGVTVGALNGLSVILPVFLCPQLSALPLSQCLPFLFLEMDLRLQPHEDKLSPMRPPQSIGLTQLLRTLRSCGLALGICSNPSLVQGCGLEASHLSGVDSVDTSSRDPPEYPPAPPATNTPWAPVRWGAEQPDLGSDQVSQTSVFPPVKQGRNRSDIPG